VTDNAKNGAIAWIDQTSRYADYIREFYEKVAGWTSQPVSMGDYEDYNMIPNGSNGPVAGICHARGSNADLPSGWLIYITVDDVDKSAAECVEMGGDVILSPRPMGKGRFCIIRDPAGAVAALYHG
jgi:predicted enzyme related to lactoylglutathione lyase